jgi:thioredoxin-like negative regulator of GroEL
LEFKQWVTKDELEARIVPSKDPIVAVFEATWCGFCRMFTEILKSYNAPKDSREVDVIDTDSGDGSLWDKYRIDIVPTIIVFREGKEIFRRDGKSMRGLSEEDLASALKSASRT